MAGAFSYDPKWRQLNAYAPELRQGPTPEAGDYLRDYVPENYKHVYDRAAAPFKALSDYVGKPTAKGLDTVTHTDQHTPENVAWGALDASGVVPAGAFAKGAALASKAMFVGPAFMRRLEEAGRIAADAKGSEDALFKAQAAWRNGADPRKVWDEHGWAPGNVFGSRWDGGHQDPVAWHHMPDIDLANYKTGSTRGTVSDVFTGIDDLKIGAPELAGLPANSVIKRGIHPSEMRGRVGSSDGRRMSDLYILGGSPEANRMLGYHELGHGVHAIDEPRNIGDVFDFDALRRTIPNTPAEAKLKEAADASSQRVNALFEQASLHKSGTPEKDETLARVRALSNDTDELRGLRDAVPQFASYMDASHERRARAGVSNYMQPPDASRVSPYPGDIDTYTRDAFWPVNFSDKATDAGVSYRDFMRPGQKADDPFPVDPELVARFSKLLVPE